MVSFTGLDHRRSKPHWIRVESAPQQFAGSETIELFGTFAWLKPPRGRNGRGCLAGVKAIFLRESQRNHEDESYD